jgi:hypothetical protein
LFIQDPDPFFNRSQIQGAKKAPDPGSGTPGFNASVLIRILRKKNIFRKSLAATELEKLKETMKQILAEAEKELEQASPLEQQQEQEKEEEEKGNVEEKEEEEEQEVRRASVSTVELDDTETHILPSASFLGTGTVPTQLLFHQISTESLSVLGP